MTVTGARFESTEPGSTLVVGPDGIAIDHVHRGKVSALFADVEAAVSWNDGDVALLTTDGFQIGIGPGDWIDGEVALGAIRAAIDPGRWIDGSSYAPLESNDRLVEAREAYAAKDWTRAVVLLESALAVAPGDGTTWRQFAFALDCDGQKGRAIAAAREAARVDPFDVWTPRFLVRALLNAKLFEDAYRVARDAVDRFPVDRLMLSVASEAFTKFGNPREAVRLGRRSTELFPEEAQAWFTLGFAARAAGLTEDAELALRRCAELEPEVASWHNNLGLHLMDVGAHLDALAAFDRALELRSDHEFAATNRILALRRLGRAAEAAAAQRDRAAREVEEAHAAIDAAGRDPMSVMRLARALRESERFAEAESLAGEALEDEPTPEGHVFLSTLLAWQERWGEARRALDAALALDPDHIGALEELAWHASRERDSATAERAARRIEMLEGHDRALEALGCAALAAADWNGARALFEEMATLRPTAFAPVAFRGLARARAGDIVGAENDLELVRERTLQRTLLERELERAVAGDAAA